MTNLLAVLPDFNVKPYAHILPALEKAAISTADLLTLDPLHVARRVHVPPGEVKTLADALLDRLRLRDGDGETPIQHSRRIADSSLGFEGGTTIVHRWMTISTLDEPLDEALAGGIAVGYLTEITGESAVGKTQFLLTLLLSVQLPGPQGLHKSALYISTEAQLQTTRLAQLLKTHPRLEGLGEAERPSLNRIQSTHIHDLEAQEHILRYQVPVIIERHNVGLLVVDSIAANYRAEFDKGRSSKGASFAQRSAQVAQLGSLLRELARTHSIAIVVANQVADRFSPFESYNHAPNFSQSTQRSRPDSPPQTAQNLNLPPAELLQNVPSHSSSSPITVSTDDPLTLDHQQRFFTGWGDDASVASLKTPSLGLTWTNQLATRIALLKHPIYEDRAYTPGEDRAISGWKRTFKIVFSAWCPDGESEFEIWQGGLRSCDMRTNISG